MKNNKQIIYFRAIWAILILLLLASAATAATARKQVKETFPLVLGGEISLENVNGRIKISSWDKESVELSAQISVKHASRRRAEEFLEEVELDINRGRDFLDIEVSHPRSRGGEGFFSSLFSWLFGGGKPNLTVNFTLRVPEEADLEIRTVNGRIDIDDITGQINSKTTNGNIDITGSSGTVTCRTVNGSISVVLEEVSRFDEMSFKTVNGGIRLAVPSSLRANLEAGTVNGSIQTDLALEVKGKLSRRSLKGRINGGGGYIILKTVNGGITLAEVD